jgi:hypothetical protein
MPINDRNERSLAALISAKESTTLCHNILRKMPTKGKRNEN